MLNHNSRKYDADEVHDIPLVRVKEVEDKQSEKVENILGLVKWENTVKWGRVQKQELEEKVASRVHVD